MSGFHVNLSDVNSLRLQPEVKTALIRLLADHETVWEFIDRTGRGIDAQKMVAAFPQDCADLTSKLHGFYEVVKQHYDVPDFTYRIAALKPIRPKLHDIRIEADRWLHTWHRVLTDIVVMCKPQVQASADTCLECDNAAIPGEQYCAKHAPCFRPPSASQVHTDDSGAYVLDTKGYVARPLQATKIRPNTKVRVRWAGATCTVKSRTKTEQWMLCGKWDGWAPELPPAAQLLNLAESLVTAKSKAKVDPKTVPDRFFAWPRKRKYLCVDKDHAKAALKSLNMDYDAKRITDQIYTQAYRNIMKAYKSFGMQSQTKPRVPGLRPGIR